MLLQQELDQDRVERRNDQFRHAMELEEQRQSYEGEIVRILSMYKLAEVIAERALGGVITLHAVYQENKSFASTQAVAATDRVQELEDKLHSVEADREQLRTALRAVTEENDELRGDLHRNESFYAVMETSYTETVQRCKMLQAALDSFEARHKDEVRQVELQCFRLKERYFISAPTH